MIDLGLFSALFGAFVIVGAGNAVNLTDGLDGLAIVPVIIAAGSFGFIAYLSGISSLPTICRSTLRQAPVNWRLSAGR